MLTIEHRMVSILLSTWSNLSQTNVFLLAVFNSTPKHMPLKYRCPYYCYVTLISVYPRTLQCFIFERKIVQGKDVSFEL